MVNDVLILFILFVAICCGWNMTIESASEKEDPENEMFRSNWDIGEACECERRDKGCQR